MPPSYNILWGGGRYKNIRKNITVSKTTVSKTTVPKTDTLIGQHSCRATFLTPPRLTHTTSAQPNPAQPNPTQPQPNPTQPNPTQPNPTQPNTTQHNPTQPPISYRSGAPPGCSSCRPHSICWVWTCTTIPRVTPPHAAASSCPPTPLRSSQESAELVPRSELAGWGTRPSENTSVLSRVARRV